MSYRDRNVLVEIARCCLYVRSYFQHKFEIEHTVRECIRVSESFGFTVDELMSTELSLWTGVVPKKEPMLWLQFAPPTMLVRDVMDS